MIEFQIARKQDKFHLSQIKAENFRVMEDGVLNEKKSNFRDFLRWIFNSHCLCEASC
jgi:hypothetical protein